MLQKKQTTNEITFVDGVVRGVTIKNGSIIKNDTPDIHFGSYTVGFNRFMRAYNNDIKIAKVINVPFRAPLQDSLYVEASFFRKKQSKDIFKVVQCQEIFDSMPPCLRLSLEKVKTKFDDSRSDVDES